MFYLTVIYLCKLYIKMFYLDRSEEENSGLKQQIFQTKIRLMLEFCTFLPSHHHPQKKSHIMLFGFYPTCIYLLSNIGWICVRRNEEPKTQPKVKQEIKTLMIQKHSFAQMINTLHDMKANPM